MTESTNADLAVIARRKGNEKRHIAAIAGTTEWARLYPRPDPNDGRLPEAAFDWPIYRAATGSTAIASCTATHKPDTTHYHPAHVKAWLDAHG